MKNLAKTGIAIGVVVSSLFISSCAWGYVGEEYSRELAKKLMYERYGAEFSPTYCREGSATDSYEVFGYTDKSRGWVCKATVYPKKGELYDDYDDVMVCKELSDRITDNISGMSEDFLVLSYEDLVVADISRVEGDGEYHWSIEKGLYGSFEDFMSKNTYQPFSVDVFILGDATEDSDVPENISKALDGINNFMGTISLYFVDDVDMKEIKECVKAFEVGYSNYFDTRPKEFCTVKVTDGLLSFSDAEYQGILNGTSTGIEMY